MHQEIFKKTLLISNPFSAAGVSNAAMKTFEDLLKANSNCKEIKSFITETKGDAEAITSEHGKNYNTIIIFGGDGTLNDVVNGIVKNNLSVNLGIFPCGTGDGFANSIGIPKIKNRILEGCNLLLNGVVREVDVGEIIIHPNFKRYFINCVDIGIVAKIVSKTNKQNKFLGGKWTYFVSTVRRWYGWKSIKMKIFSDNTKIFEGKMTTISILNGSDVGAGLRFVPWAEVNDGEFDLFILKAVSKIRLFITPFKILFQKHKNDKNIMFFKSKKGIIESEDDTYMHIDGETIFPITAGSYIEFNLIPFKINFIFPSYF